LLPLVVLTGVVLGACSTGMPGGSTRQAKDIHSLYVFILILALAVFFAVEFAIVWSVLRYRRRPGDDELPKQTHGHFGVEILWTAIPTVIVATLFILSLRTLDRVDAKEAAPSETIEVTGFQWQWTFKYPAEGVVIRGSTEKPPEMVLPVNEPIRIKEKSADVIHSFYVPNFNFKRDVIPGYENSFDFTPTEKRVFRGQCAEFCGLLHNKMTFSIRVVDRAEFEAWVAEQKRLAEEAIAKCGDPTDSVKITAQNIQFDKACLPIKANVPFTIEFENKDNVTHNVDIYEDETAAKTLMDPAHLPVVFAGPGSRTYEVPAGIPEGTFFFRCDVHPVMQGTVITRWATWRQSKPAPNFCPSCGPSTAPASDGAIGPRSSSG